MKILVYVQVYNSFCLSCLIFLLIFRYVDMIANPDVADVFRKRAKVNHSASLLTRKQLKPTRFLVVPLYV